MLAGAEVLLRIPAVRDCFHLCEAAAVDRWLATELPGMTDGGTALYDSILFSLLQYQGEPGRRALIVITDGIEGGPSAAEERVRELAQQMLGSTLVTVQTGEEGKRVNRLYVEQGVDIARELYRSSLEEFADMALYEKSFEAFLEGRRAGLVDAVAARRHGLNPTRHSRAFGRFPPPPRA